MSASGRVCEITNGRFVEAKHEKRWLAVRLLRSKPAGRFGSISYSQGGRSNDREGAGNHDGRVITLPAHTATAGNTGKPMTECHRFKAR